MPRFLPFAAALILSFTSAAAPVPGAPASPRGLLLATWNLEWLLTPETFAALKDHCSRDGDEHRAVLRQLPCDVARTLERGAADLSALRRYAEALDPDVVAVQEVDGANAARQIFRNHEFCFTGSPALQNTGFAIRRGVPFRCEPDLWPLSLGDSVRRGAVVTIYPGTTHEFRLLGVHLKSGCARQSLDGPQQACRMLSRQIPSLEGWIEAQARAGERFAVLGDFNRDLLAEEEAARHHPRRTLLGDLNDDEPRDSHLYSAASRSDFRNCVRGQPHTGFIDYILLGEALHTHVVAGSVQRVTWSAADAAHYILSDHCPVAVRISP